MAAIEARVAKQLSWRIRTAATADLPQMQRLDKAGNEQSSWQEADFVSSLSGRYLSLVAEPESKLALLGFVIASRVGDEGEIMNIAVDLPYRRQGVARALLESVLNALRSEAVSECFLDVREHNAGAIALYRSLGFVECGRRADYYQAPGERENALLIRLDLL